MDFFDVVPGESRDSLLGRALIYQLLLVQFVFAHKGSTDRLAESLNSHPLTAKSASISQEEAEDLYKAITSKYSELLGAAIQSENATLKARLLAEILYRKYKDCLFVEISKDEAEFNEAYNRLVDN